MRRYAFLLVVLTLGFRTLAVAQPAIDPEAATEAYLATVSAEDRERSDAYFEGGYWLQLIGFLYGLGVAWVLLSSRLSARMRDWAEKWLQLIGFLCGLGVARIVLSTRLSARIRDWAEKRTGRGFLGSALYVVQYIVVTFVLGFPLAVYQGFIREHQYGLATQTFGPWMRDQLVGLAVGLVMGALAISALYIAIRKAGRRWWLYGAAGGVVFLAFMMVIGPVFIAPLFNTYELLEDPTVRDPILSMARANGVPATGVYEFDASRQSNRISANVSGFLATMRISLNDNLLERCSLSEIKSVMGHEIGHYALNHVQESILFFGLVLAGGFAFVNGFFEKLRSRWGERFGIADIGDMAGLPLLGVLLSTYMFVLTPVLNSYIRTNEAEPDVFGLNAAREPDGFATVSLKLGEYRKLSPGPLEEMIFFNHPSGRSRILTAMTWKAEEGMRDERKGQDPSESAAEEEPTAGHDPASQ